MRIELLKDGVTFARLLLAMEIPLVGRTVCKALAQEYSLNDFEVAIENGDNFARLKGLNQETNRCIHAWFKENMDQWENAKSKYPIDVLVVNTESINCSNIPSALEGLNIVVTGKVYGMSRKDIGVLYLFQRSYISKSSDKAYRYVGCG